MLFPLFIVIFVVFLLTLIFAWIMKKYFFGSLIF